VDLRVSAKAVGVEEEEQGDGAMLHGLMNVAYKMGYTSLMTFEMR
jgi:hypothetical protein